MRRAVFCLLVLPCLVAAGEIPAPVGRHCKVIQITPRVPEPAWRAGLVRALEQEVTVNWNEADITDVVADLNKLAGVNCVLDPESVAMGVNPVVMQVRQITLKNCIGFLEKLTGLHTRLMDGAIYFTSHPHLGEGLDTRVYLVDQVLAGLSRGVSVDEGDLPELVGAILPENCFDGEETTIETMDHSLWGGPALKVRHAPAVHAKVLTLLDHLAERRLPATPAPAWLAPLERRLDGHLDAVDFEDSTLEEVLEYIRKQTAIDFIIDPQFLADCPPPITMKLKDISVRHVLNFIERFTGGRAVLRNQVVFITAEDLPRQDFKLRLYDLLGTTAANGAPEEVADLIQNNFEPESWEHVDAGIDCFGTFLLVRNSPAVHAEIERLLGTFPKMQP